MTDANEQEKMDLSQTLIQQGKHDEVEEAVKELQKRQEEQLERTQAELASELNTTEAKLQMMIDDESSAAVAASHRSKLDDVSSFKNHHISIFIIAAD